MGRNILIFAMGAVLSVGAAFVIAGSLREASDDADGKEVVHVDSARVDIDQVVIELETIELNGEVVEALSGGHPADHDWRMEPLASLQEGLNLSESERVEVHVDGLVPYLTMTRVLFTVSESERIPVHRFGHITESSYDVDQSHLRPEFDRKETLLAGDPDPLKLAIRISVDGFYVHAKGTVISPIDGCDSSGPTVCLVDDEIDISAVFQKARRADSEGDQDRAARYYDQALDAYDFRELYNVLRKLRDVHNEGSPLRLSADSQLPAGLVFEAMKTAEVQLANNHYKDHDTYQQARRNGNAEGWLFPNVFLAVYQ